MALVAAMVGMSVVGGAASSVFWLVVVMMSLVVQMVGGVGDAVVVRGGLVGRGTRIQVVCGGVVAISRRCCFRWCS